LAISVNPKRSGRIDKSAHFAGFVNPVRAICDLLNLIFRGKDNAKASLSQPDVWIIQRPDGRYFIFERLQHSTG
jgi:hypothetical protein